MNRISEAGALLILPNLLTGDAHELFMANQDYPDEYSGFANYPEAFNFLLRHYAKDSYIEKSIDKFDGTIQLDGETELAYAKRLKEANRHCGSVYRESELVRRFVRGLNPAVKPMLTR